MTRWHTLAVCCLLALSAGCLSSFSGPYDCEYDQVTAIPFPELPTDLSREAASTFAVEYEHARFLDREAGEYAEANIGVEAEQVSRLGDGWLVNVSGGVSIDGCTGGGGDFHGDGHIDAQYFVNDSAAFRAWESDSPVDPGENGTVRIA